ncbi:hypothetical protein JXJ21_14895 [candidate division KSB1 bacterium]|nr:hypothetical protein [candidate division KSB1 bacterium]
MNQRTSHNGRYKDKRLQLGKIDEVIIEIQRKLQNSWQPINIDSLTAYERKRIHTFFDNKPEYKTKTYRDGENFIFRVYPLKNLKAFAEEKAKEALSSNTTVALPPMGNYERFIIHDHLKTWDGIETTSFGENDERHIEISPKKFGRTLKKIIKKIKLF